ncbi:MAG TPA: molybdopterin-dependent oxidoreductase [Thermomicrobiaceae bacterium]|nr:molybdopterin-dependent oxidoreductase [Thermomicrobiaceae bacterium]
MHRRDFLKLAAGSGAGSVLFIGCNATKYASTWGDGDPKHEFQIESPVLVPNDLQYHRDTWYATAYPGVGGGSGLVVRVFEGRAKKVEGNPIYPLNMGRSLAVEQALLQELYHPDRLQTAQELTTGAARGSGKFVPIKDWDAALAKFNGMLNSAKGKPNFLLTGPVSGTTLAIINEFTGATGAKHLMLDRDENVVLREAMRRVFGVGSLPTLDLAHANTLVSFGAELLGDWISPVQFQMGYGEFRHGRGDTRGTFWYVGPQMTATAASADHWLPVRPGTEGYVALAVANALGGSAAAAFPGASLDQFAPETVAAKVAAAGMNANDVANRIRALANDFKNGPSISIGGGSAAAQTNGLFNVAAAFALNLAGGNVGKPGGIVLNPGSPNADLLPTQPAATPYRDVQGLANTLRGAGVVMVFDTNPVFSVPANPSLGEVLLGSGAQIVSFSSYVDETSLIADLILPNHTTLESWGAFIPDPGPGYPVVALQQPVVEPFYATRQFTDILLDSVKALGGQPKWATTQDAVTAAITSLRGKGGNISASTDIDYFLDAQSQGGWWDTGSRVSSTPAAPSNFPAPTDPGFAGDPGQYPYYLVPYPHFALGYGERSVLPWLQALPEPMSTAVWTTWVELNHHTADKIGVGIGDVVKLITPSGTLEAPVYVNPAAAPDVALIPFGNGHTAGTRYDEGRGVNPFGVLANQTEATTGALAWGATRVKIVKANKKVRLPLFQGSIQPYQEEGFPIVQTMLPKTT